MILVEANRGTERYAFLTAKVRELAKIGFTRFTMHPGEEVIVTAVLAANRVFDRSRIDGNQAR